MTDPEEQQGSARLGFIILIMVVLLVLYVVMVFFDEKEEEPEGIFVRFILFFKQSILI